MQTSSRRACKPSALAGLDVVERIVALVESGPVSWLCVQVEHFVYMSSAGVYLKSDQMPHREVRYTQIGIPPDCSGSSALTNEHHRGTSVSCLWTGV